MPWGVNVPIAAELFHCKPARHYVAAIFVSSDVVIYMDSLKPGSEPPKHITKQIEESFSLPKKYCVKSQICQAQRGPACLLFALANLDAVLSGNDISKLQLSERFLRASLVESLITGSLHFPSERCPSRGEAKLFAKKLKH